MLAYATLGTKDLPKAAAFYDEVLGVLGARRFMEEPDYFIAWGNSETGAGLGITYPFDKQAASVGNGTMVALQGDSRAQVDAVHAKALELGGTDEGAPGQRWPGFYAAYFRDLDGNKLNCCYMGE
ncbi:VOC family protein [Thermomonas aquatica]|jgi:catechol 2,3-dioxygenase-like lactoylglutathione lyase family enzyme|uniref:VOC family protein n=1 Tax=Thermomonas aquatica TaxID=2202149 RepID=A0A5B7ZN82_9GAMM|nr:VOC family protein [Thermomonas aquatica]QDA56601.1 VOC family protein [Thermomonas aquatica]